VFRLQIEFYFFEIIPITLSFSSWVKEL